MKTTLIISALILPLMASCNLGEVLGDFGDGTAFDEMGTTYRRAGQYTYENYTKHMMESTGASAQERERQNMYNDAAKRANRR